MDTAILLQTLVLMLVAYLAGSIPMGVVVARVSGGTDPRTIGSGRTGGTNALRALGRGRAAIVVVGDLLKGAVPVLLARYVTGGDPLVEVLCGAAAVAGAIWSVFAGFRSGRGVGTGVGTMLVIQPVAVLLATPVFIGVILLTRYVSLGSLVGSAAMFPAMLLVLLVVPDTPLPYVHLLGRRRRARSGWPTPTTSTGCSTARSASSTSGCWRASARAAETWASSPGWRVPVSSRV